MPGYGFQQLIRLDGFVDVIHGAEREAEVPVFDDGRHHDRDVRSVRIAFQGIEDGPAIGFRHQHIQRDDVRSGLPHFLQSLIAIYRRCYAVAFTAEVARNDFAYPRVVVHYQHCSCSSSGLDFVRFHLFDNLVPGPPFPIGGKGDFECGTFALSAAGRDIAAE